MCCLIITRTSHSDFGNSDAYFAGPEGALDAAITADEFRLGIRGGKCRKWKGEGAPKPMTLSNTRSLGVRSVEAVCRCGRESIVDVSALAGDVAVSALAGRFRCAEVAGPNSCGRTGWRSVRLGWDGRIGNANLGCCHGLSLPRFARSKVSISQNLREERLKLILQNFCVSRFAFPDDKDSRPLTSDG
jgi:hypothetical protein